MKKSFSILLCLLIAGFISAEKLGTLDKVLKPGSMVIGGDKIYIGEDCSFYVYSLQDLKFLHKFGKKGEGPGELKYLPILPNVLTPAGDKIFAEGIDKIITYSAECKYIKEDKKMVRGMKFLPVGKNFIGIVVKTREAKAYNALTLVDAKWKVIKELHEQVFPQGAPSGGKIPIIMVPDSIHYTVYKDKIYVEKSDQGFIIDVYDLKGIKLSSIKKNIVKNMIEKDDKEIILAEFKKDKEVRRQTNTVGGWDTFKKLLKLIYPQFFPSIQNIMIRDDKIYVQTFERKGDKEKYHILDLKGKELGNCYLPVSIKTSFIARMVGAEVDFFDIKDNTFYYLVENEDEEEWEIHFEKIKY